MAQFKGFRRQAGTLDDAVSPNMSPAAGEFFSLPEFAEVKHMLAAEERSTRLVPHQRGVELIISAATTLAGIGLERAPTLSRFRSHTRTMGGKGSTRVRTRATCSQTKHHTTRPAAFSHGGRRENCIYQ